MSPSAQRERFKYAAANAALLLSLAVTLALVGPGPEAASAKKGKQRNGDPAALYWGAQIGKHLTGEEPPWDMKALYKFERATRKKVSLASFSAPFAKCGKKRCSFYTFPATPMQNLRDQGVIPFFSWSSSGKKGTRDPRFRLSKVIRGRYDSYIRKFASAAAEWGHPFFLRFNWEMNGDWFPWSEGVNGNRKGQFVKAWRHVHRIFTSVGATNATWVWCPNVGFERKYRGLYPGNRYVDWTCLDGYNWGTRFHWSRWQSFNDIFSHAYRDVRRIAPRKPMIIAEVASTSYGGSKAAWIRNMLRLVRTRYKKVRGLIWFDVNDRGTRWPIERPRQVRKAFAAGIRNPAFRPNLYGAINSSPIPPPTR